MKEGWEYKKLGDVCKIYQPQTIASSLLKEDGKYPVFGANGMIGRYDSYNHEDPEVLLCCRGATCGAINVSLPFSWINGNAMVVKPINDSFLKSFLRYLLQTLDYSHIITGAAQPQITRTSLSPVTVPVPTIIEQQSIVDYLDSAFAKIDAMKANAEKALDEAKTLFQASLKGMLEPKEGWEEKKLGDVASFARGLTYSKNDEAESSENIVLRSNNIDLSSSKLDFTELKFLKRGFLIPEDKRLKQGSIFICMSNGSKAHLGKVAYVDKDYGYAFGGFMGQITPYKEINGRFLHYALSSPEYKQYIRSLSEGANINNLKFKDLELFPLSIPPISEQQSIVASLDSLKSKVNRLQENFDKISQECDALKQAILRQVFE